MPDTRNRPREGLVHKGQIVDAVQYTLATEPMSWLIVWLDDFTLEQTGHKSAGHGRADGGLVVLDEDRQVHGVGDGLEVDVDAVLVGLADGGRRTPG